MKPSHSKPIEIIRAPSALGLTVSGVEMLPDALISAGLAERLGASIGELVAPPTGEGRREGSDDVLNAQALRNYALSLAERVGDAFDRDRLPIVLGGDCSILIGCMLAVRRRARSGLLFVDGHADFFQPAAEPKGEAASMELGFVTGHGPAQLADFEGLRPLAREDDVVAIGRRDHADTEEYGSRKIEASRIRVIDLAEARRLGIAKAAAWATAHVAREELHGFWLHFDADVLDDQIMPAVDDRQPDGLSWRELDTLLQSAAGSGKMLGMTVTIFNPKLDQDGSIAKSLVEAIVKGLGKLL